MNVDNSDIVCEKYENLIDEYIHMELDNETTAEFENHIENCAHCKSLLDNQIFAVNIVKKFGENTQYNIAENVMGEIIEKRLIIDKPPRKINFMPHLFSSAIVLIAVFILGKYNVLNKASKDLDGILNETAADSLFSLDSKYSGELKAYNSQEETASVSFFDSYGVADDAEMYGDSDSEFLIEDGADSGYVISPRTLIEPATEAAQGIEFPTAISGNKNDTDIINEIKGILSSNNLQNNVNSFIVIQNTDEDLKNKLLFGISVDMIDGVGKSDFLSMNMFLENAQKQDFTYYRIIKDDENSDIIIFKFES